jgi:hypothetical protein
MAKTRTVYRNRRVKRHHSKRKFTLPLSVVAGFCPGVSYAWAGYKSAGFTGATNNLAYAFGGFDAATGKFNMAGLYRGTIPAVGGFIIHMIASKFGINRQLSRMGIPIVRI